MNNIMIARDLINDEIPPLKVTDTASKALDWMEEFRVSHLPVVKDKELMGIVSDVEILDLNNKKEQIGKLKIPLMKVFVTEDKHAFDALRLISHLKLTLLPVLDTRQNYIGSITANNLMHLIAAMPAVQEPGSIIVLEMSINDYSLSQIAQIVEGNNAKVLSCYVTAHVDSTKIEVTIKINKEDVSGILQTFARFKYTVKASFHHSEYTEDLKQRFDEFMHYINI